ncbi:MAG: hypothetical protein R3E01_18410 [Pirellulaceae bacterium]|nr:hypothetical protein [Planctomycetales bacterium]
MMRTYRISARYPSGNLLPLAVDVIPPGHYRVRAIAGTPDYSAWTAWSRGVPSDCDRDGRHCTRGWMTFFELWSPRSVETTANRPTNERFCSPEKALEHPCERTFYVVDQASIVVFYIDDSIHDNDGGLTLCVESLPTHTADSSTSSTTAERPSSTRSSVKGGKARKARND